MALAWAQAQAPKEASALSALLASSDGGAAPRDGATGAGSAQSGDGRGSSDRSTTAGTCAHEGASDGAASLQGDYVLVLTQVLPDGLGDLIFGENAVLELQDVARVAWLRYYTGDDGVAPGERLIQQTAASACCSIASPCRSGFFGSIDAGKLEALWAGARERFLAPWIFGLSAHEEGLLRLARSTGKPFWALTEYGRSMGHIHTYTSGLGAMIPTGWSIDRVAGDGGVFRSILRAPRTDTDWRHAITQWCGIADAGRARLWWFYSRKDDEKKHSFSLLGQETQSGGGVALPIRKVAKAIPVGSNGKILLTNEKTSGEKLAEQLFQVANDPGFKPNTDVTCSEAAAGSAGQLSQFIWGVLFDKNFAARSSSAENSSEIVDIIVTPNVLTDLRKASGGDHAVADVVQLNLIEQSGYQHEVPLPAGRRLLLCSVRIPRGEMRTFLEQCEERVFTTGDQSLTEAMFMGKIPCVKPDAKVHQWQAALLARAAGAVEAVPDLGETLRSLVASEDAREAARGCSRLRSLEVERHITAQLGGRPETWTPTQQVLARAGMLG